MTLYLSPLEQTELDLIHTWLNKPHLYPFYMQEPISLEDVQKKISPRVNDQHTIKCVIARDDGNPFGYMQWYLNCCYPDYGAAVIGRTRGVSIDYYIGDERYLGRGLGSEMLCELIKQSSPQLSSDDKIYYIGHDNQNLKAIRCTQKAGFKVKGTFVEKDKESTLFARVVSV